MPVEPKKYNYYQDVVELIGTSEALNVLLAIVEMAPEVLKIGVPYSVVAVYPLKNIGLYCMFRDSKPGQLAIHSERTVSSIFNWPNGLSLAINQLAKQVIEGMANAESA